MGDRDARLRKIGKRKGREVNHDRSLGRIAMLVPNELDAI